MELQDTSLCVRREAFSDPEGVVQITVPISEMKVMIKKINNLADIVSLLTRVSRPA